MTASGTVLIVEDTETAGATLEMALLSIPGLSVVLLRSAEEALRLLDSEDTVCALVTDLNMPRMDGFELIERVRTGARHARLPIVVVSGDTDPRTPERVRRLGVDAFFAKPYSPAQVRQKLEQLLNGHHLPEPAAVS
jgi:CheY-like chemotaxis protein